jgi:tetratricopeptide (TPR) repeat protein
MAEEKTKVDEIIDWFKNKPVLAIIIVIIIIITTLGGFTGSLQNLMDFFGLSKPSTPIVKVQLPGQEPKKCEFDILPKKPFKYKNSTKILIAVFEGGRQEAKEFGTDISMSVADRLHEYCKDSLDISVEDIEVVRLNCFVQSHSEAREILDRLGADIFLWGNNFCVPGSEEAKFCPNATLTKGVSPLEAIGERIKVKEQLAITDLDLPSLTAEKPYQLLNFIFGLHFYLRRRFKEAGVYFEKAGDEIYRKEKGIEYIYSYIGYTYHFLAKYDKSFTYFERCLKIFHDLGDRKNEGVTLNNIASIYYAWGRYDQALEYYKRSLKITEEVGDRQGEGVTLDNIGMVYHAWGKYDQAIEYHKKSLKIFEDLGDRKNEGITLNNIAGVYYAWGKYDQAIEYYKRNLKLFQEIGDRIHEGGTLNNIGEIYRTWGKYDQAIEYYEKSLKIREDIGDRKGEGVTLNNIGMVYYAWGKYDQAIEYYKRSLKIFEDIGDRQGEGVVLNCIGVIYKAWGKYDQAIEYQKKSLEISEEVGDRQGEGATLNNIGAIYKAWGKYDQAIEHISKSLNIFEEIGAAVEAEKVRKNLKQIQEEMKKNQNSKSKMQN